VTRRFGVAAFSVAAHIALGTGLGVLSVLSADTLPTPRSVLAFDSVDPILNHTAADVRGRTGVDGVEAGGFGFGGGLGITEPPPPLAPTQPVRLHWRMTPPRKVHDLLPAYPAQARAARAEGLVVLEAIIDVEGRVASLRVLRPVPLLTEAALDAVRQWRYEPAWLNGQPVPVVMTVTVNFTLDR
jgi:protein TonB